MKKTFKHCLLAAMFLAPFVAGAQATIGSGKVPEPFSVLELVSNNTLGLRLPQMTTNQRKEMEETEEFKAAKTGAAMGLQIFNTSTRCVETWNGTVWISKCVMCGDEPCQYLYYKCTDLGDVHIPRFMAHNLGADPSLNTPKDQMRYLANAGPSTTTNHGRVFGGRYQWGRKNLPYAISQDGDYTLYDGTTNKAAALNNPVYDANGQIFTNDGINATDLFIGVANNWASGLAVEDRDKLWGNGVYVRNPTTQPGGILYTDGNTYQSPVKTVNDPCPKGWRVPTQDEWERIGKYGCSPNYNGSNTLTISSINGTVPHINSPFTWVPVVCGGTAGDGQCKASKTWGSNNSGINAGYAIYKREDWDNRPDKSAEADLLSATSPEPFLFLPAAGTRNYGSSTVANVGSRGSYWSSSLENANSASHLALGSTSVTSGSSSSVCSYGLSIRCVAE